MSRQESARLTRQSSGAPSKAQRTENTMNPQCSTPIFRSCDRSHECQSSRMIHTRKDAHGEQLHGQNLSGRRGCKRETHNRGASEIQREHAGSAHAICQYSCQKGAKSKWNSEQRSVLSGLLHSEMKLTADNLFHAGERLLRQVDHRVRTRYHKDHRQIRIAIVQARLKISVEVRQ